MGSFFETIMLNDEQDEENRLWGWDVLLNLLGAGGGERRME